MTTIYGTTHPVISSQTVDSSTSLTYPNDHSFALHEPTASSITSQITTPSPTAATSGTQLCESCENLCDRWYAIPDWGNLELKIIDHPFDEGSRAGCALCSVLQRYAAPPWKNLNCPKTAIAITAQGLNWSISGEYRDSVDDGWYPDVRLTTCLIPSMPHFHPFLLKNLD
jgi:hypothetical protein